MLRNHPHIGKNSEGIGVAKPSRNDMEMKMLLNTRTGDFAEVKPNVETIRIHRLFEYPDGRVNRQEGIPFLLLLADEVWTDVALAPPEDDR